MNSSNVAVKVESLSQVKKRLSFDVPWDDVKKEMDDVYREVGKKAKIKGFRNGKVPRRILESFYKEHAENETIANIVNKFYWDAIKENEIEAVTQPEIDQHGIEENKPFTFSATVETEPSIIPEGYVGMKIDKDEFEVTDQDIDARLEEIRKMFVTLEDIEEDRAAKESDSVLIDFKGSLDGAELPELKAEDYILEIGSKNFVPGFEEELVGMKRGENKEINVLFPDDYHAKNVAGKNVLFSVLLKGIKEKKLPEIDESFVKNFEKYDSIIALKNDIKKSLEEDAKRKTFTALKNKIMDCLLEINHFEAPPSFIERQTYYMMADMQKRMMAGGMSSDDAIQLSVKMRDQFKEEAEKIVKSMLLLKNIAKKESMSVSGLEIDDRIREIAERNQKDFQTLKKSFEKDDSLATLESDILGEKIFKYIEEKAEITVNKKSFSDSKEE